jgi:hypothetical protein
MPAGAVSAGVPEASMSSPSWSRGAAPKVGAGKVDQLIGAAVQQFSTAFTM